MHVLVIDPAGASAARLQTSLSGEGYAVDTTQQRPDALWLLEEHHVDAVVLCTRRPDAADTGMCRAIRATAPGAGLMVLARQATAGEQVSVLDAGADEVATSPVRFSVLAARLRALLRRAGAAAAPMVQVGELRIDLTRMRAWRGEVEIVLSPREFALLRTFMNHPGHVLTRSRLFDTIWQHESDVASNVVDQCVAALRRKVDRPFGCADIATVRGVGYRLLDPGPADGAVA